ncbi:hypothetical protein [Jiangella sp. DSM 45060]|uniref:hypothetical protein n=1 Tax=Jiangella sp. DSM 45060 TaxID=1798224 RepID=UPI000879EED3|nr:hypothetical protein [Jiangella sp. DSM 45060]SDT47757.1 Phage integrase, N-terminal SAM-like domain [Jiangella sp. DSM 45060]
MTATAGSRTAAQAELKERLVCRPGYGTGGLLSLSRPFGDLVELWLADLEQRDIAENTKNNYRDDLRLHARPFFEHFILGEITTGRGEAFLKAEQAISYSRANHSRTSGTRLGSGRRGHPSGVYLKGGHRGSLRRAGSIGRLHGSAGA